MSPAGTSGLRRRSPVGSSWLVPKRIKLPSLYNPLSDSSAKAMREGQKDKPTLEAEFKTNPLTLFVQLDGKKSAMLRGE